EGAKTLERWAVAPLPRAIHEIHRDVRLSPFGTELLDMRFEEGFVKAKTPIYQVINRRSLETGLNENLDQSVRLGLSGRKVAVQTGKAAWREVAKRLT